MHRDAPASPTPALQSTARAFSGARVLITGGAGFLGSNLALALLAAGARVLIADHFDPDLGANPHNLLGAETTLELARCDLRHAAELPALVRDVDYLFAFAGRSSHLDSMRAPEADLDDNCRVALSLLEACRHHNPSAIICFASTRQIYGRPLHLPVDEAHPALPVDLNGAHKLAADHYHRVYHLAHGLRTRVLRLTNTIGPRMRIRDARQNFVGSWVRAVLEDRPVEVWGGAQRRDFTYVDDALDAFLRLARHDASDGQAYNLGGSACLTLHDFATRLIAAHGQGSLVIKPFPSERRAIDIGDYCSDDRKFRAATGWSPATTIDDALALTVAYFRAHLPHYV